jgi:hypothetical protein
MKMPVLFHFLIDLLFFGGFFAGVAQQYPRNSTAPIQLDVRGLWQDEEEKSKKDISYIKGDYLYNLFLQLSDCFQ